jgi:glucokinase
MTQKYVLAFDLGGTKLCAGIVSERGKILAELREPTKVEEGKEGVVNQMAAMGSLLLKKYSKFKSVGIASAGPLDPTTGVLLDPTNFTTSTGKTWGKVPLAKMLSKKMKKPVHMENDAAAAMLAEHWIGAAKKYKNAMILTLGTGLGTGIICNGSLVRAGRNLHTEAGHLILKDHDQTAPCGCGNLGCAEAYLSGRNFTRRAHARFGDPHLEAQDLANLARGKDPRALAAFEEYARIMAVAIHNYVVIYCPEIVIFTGSFAQTSDLFLEKTQEYLEDLLLRRRVGVDLMPKLAISTLEGKAGLIGGAYVAFHNQR